MAGTRKFAICIHADANMLITPRKVYEVFNDPKGETSGYIRVVDDEGEDYLYPAKYFVTVPVSQAVEDAILEAA